MATGGARGERRTTRREFLASGAAAACLVDAAHADGVAADDSESRPNVLVFFTDQQRWDTCGCYHDSSLRLTPNLDRMAGRGALVRHSFSCQPLCAPARGTFQTGLYGTQHGVWRNGIPLSSSSKTLAHYFRNAGYLTGYIGKWHLGSTGDRPVPPAERGGYEYWLAADVLESVSHPYDLRLFDGDGREQRRPGYRVDAQTDCVVDFLRERKAEPARPFFLFASYLEPHHQNDLRHFVAPNGYAERYRRHLWVPPDLKRTAGDWREESPDYYGIVARLDENLGRVLDELKRSGLDKTTVVMFCSDHGCHFRTRNSEYKRSCHEDSIRVPTVLQGPGFDGGGVVEQLVSTPDWPVTLLDAAGIGIPGQMPGRSILAALRGDTEGWPEEVFVQISESQVGRAIRTRRWKYGVNAPDKKGSEVPSSDVYVEQYLYDLKDDPAERRNLAGSARHRKTADNLMALLKRRMADAGERAPEILPAPTLS